MLKWGNVKGTSMNGLNGLEKGGEVIVTVSDVGSVVVLREGRCMGQGKTRGLVTGAVRGVPQRRGEGVGVVPSNFGRREKKVRNKRCDEPKRRGRKGR